jgi:7-cyano-7-deazaguanine synthase
VPRRIGQILLSGGLDSTTLAALAQRETDELLALTLNYGQRHAIELEAARKVAARLGIAHKVIDVRFYRDLARHSALTDSDDYDLPTDRKPDEIATGIPVTYVPLRNTFFLTLAAASLESRVLDVIENEEHPPDNIEPVLYIAANALDYSGYPDCRPEFYDTITETLRLGSKIGTQYGCAIRIETPLIDKSKADIARLGVSLGAPLEVSWSCYSAGPTPCGHCDSCLLRAKGFAEAGIDDPALQGGGG